MNNERIDLETTIAWAKHEVDLKGEGYVYREEERGEGDDLNPIQCNYYEDDGTPSCIVGHILDRHGLMNAEGAPDWEGEAAHCIAPVSKNFSVPASDFLRSLQTWQDRGAPWGEALRVAIEDATNLPG